MFERASELDGTLDKRHVICYVDCEKFVEHRFANDN